MAAMKQILTKFRDDEQGLETVEYAVMTALVVTTIITAIGLLVTAISGRFGDVASTINGI